MKIFLNIFSWRNPIFSWGVCYTTNCINFILKNFLFYFFILIFIQTLLPKILHSSIAWRWLGFNIDLLTVYLFSGCILIFNNSCFFYKFIFSKHFNTASSFVLYYLLQIFFTDVLFLSFKFFNFHSLNLCILNILRIWFL